MIRAGLDLGTTNSLLCLYDTESQEYSFFQFDSNARNFFPTMIAYNNKRKSAAPEIGTAAKKRLQLPGYDTYHSFKLQLNEKAGECAGRERSPRKVTEDFLRELFGKLEYDKGQNMEYIVQTIPDVWQNEADYRNAAECLTEIYTDLGMETDTQFSFESEPVAAAVYYCQKHCQGNYTGHIVVIDYGGGTLDLTLCRVLEDGVIQPLRRCGSGGSAGGFAGRAFDVALTEKMLQKYQEEYELDLDAYQEGSRNFEELCSDLETEKIDHAKETTALLERYYMGGRNTDAEMIAFSVNTRDGYEFEVSAADMAETFETVNETVLRQEVSKMIQMCTELGIDTNSQDNMRVLMVGGFSNMYCVESVIRELFDSGDGLVDDRFDAHMDRQERSVAIAYGAALIASNKVRIEHLSKYEIGIYAYDPEQEKDVAYPVIERDMPIKRYRQPQFYQKGDVKTAFRIGFTPREAHLRFYFDDGTGKKPVKTEQTLAELCPNSDEPENFYEFGFSVNNRNTPILHVRDKNGTMHSESLKDLLESISLQIVK